MPWGTSLLQLALGREVDPLEEWMKGLVLIGYGHRPWRISIRKVGDESSLSLGAQGWTENGDMITDILFAQCYLGAQLRSHAVATRLERISGHRLLPSTDRVLAAKKSSEAPTQALDITPIVTQVSAARKQEYVERPVQYTTFYVAVSDERSVLVNARLGQDPSRFRLDLVLKYR
jgi:hypothetical protein